MQQKTLRLFWHYSKPYNKRRWFVLANSAITVIIASFVGPYFLSQIFTQLQDGGISLESAWPIIAAYTLTQIYGEIVGWRMTLLAIWTFETSAQRDLFLDIFKKLSRETLDFHSNRFGGSLVSQATKLGGAFERFWDTLAFQATPTLASILAATLILWQYFWQYALLLLIISIIYIAIVVVFSRFLRERNKLEAQASTKMNGRLADMITNVSTVKAYGNEKAEYNNAKVFVGEWRNRSLHTMRGFLAASSVYSSLNVILTVTAVVSAIIASQNNMISIGVVYLALTYTLTVVRQLWETNNIMRNYNRIMGDANDMVEILDSPIKLVDSSTKRLHVKKGDIEIDSVSFTHDDGDGVNVFDNFSLNIPPGQRIGVVGHSGSGKTTLTRLLLRFSDVQNGHIRIDGQDIADHTQESLHKSVAYVPQEPMLFHRSLRENIAYGKPDASEQEIIEAAKQANAYEFITQLKDGFDTLVGERGVKLSGGQRQRIAIARAILKDSPVLILDEATSALDSESEKLIQEALTKLMKGRTSIVIAHRLSTISKLDRIVVLDHGKIVEDDTHAQLLHKKGIYAKLWSHQSGGFIEE